MREHQFKIHTLQLTILVMLIALSGQSQHRLALLHPTAGNIESMIWMVENKVIDIPGVELIGVYSSEEAYDYQASIKYIKELHIAYYKLQKIEGIIKPAEIYRENSCSQAFRKLFEESDAILLFGGPDIPAAVYGEKQNVLTIVTDPQRHYFETSLFFHLIGRSRNPAFEPYLAENPEFLIRAFCLGMQTMNVAAGGTLIQDIPSELYHKNTLKQIATQRSEEQHQSYLAPQIPQKDLFGGIFHQIRIASEGYLKEIAGKSDASFPKVLSYHHQAVGRIGVNLKVIATSIDDKIIESLQHAIFKNVIGVQFYPESPSLYNPETRFKTIPGSSFSPNELLKKSNSLAFHRLFWKYFSEKIEKSKRPVKN